MERSQRLKELLKEKILVLDGAMGTALQSAGLSAQDFGGEAFEGCNEVLNLTRPDVVEAIHRGYLEAGADIIETNTFGSTALVLAEYPPLNEKAYEITRRGAEIARRMADQYSTPEKPRFVAGAMGPTTKAISVTGGVTFEELVETYEEQARGLIDGGVDYLLIETAQDTRNVKAALIGIQRALDAGRFGARSRVGHHRADGDDARRAGRGGLCREPRARRPPLHRPQLRHRPRVHGRPHPGDA